MYVIYHAAAAAVLLISLLLPPHTHTHIERERERHASSIISRLAARDLEGKEARRHRAMSSASWAGRVAVHCQLDAREVAATTTTTSPATSLPVRGRSGLPPPVVALLPRSAYLPMLAAPALALHRDLLPPGEDTTWFSYRGLPLKWQLPVGVLYDLLVAGRETPWTVTVHHRLFPAAVLLPLHAADAQHEEPAQQQQRQQNSASTAVRRQWLSSLKEAHFIQRGSAGANSVMEVGEEHADAMFAAIGEGDWERYMNAVSATSIGSSGARMASSSSVSSSAQHASNIPLPLRICSMDIPSDMGRDTMDADAVKDKALDWTSFEFSSAPMPATRSVNGNVEFMTLRDVLIDWGRRTGTCAVADKQGEAARPEENDDAGWIVAGETAPRLHHNIFVNRAVQVVVGGVEPPLSCRLDELFDSLRSPDGFLYIVIRSRTCPPM